MEWLGVKFLCSSSPKFVLLRLALVVLVRNILWLAPRFSDLETSIGVLQKIVPFTVIAFFFVTGFPLRQIVNILRSSVLIGSVGRVPGPLLAKASRVWKIWQVLRGDFDLTIRELHCKHGSIVQISPEEYSFSDPVVIDEIYRGSGSGWRKADWYWTGGPPDAETQGLFSNRDPEAHGRVRRRLAPAYRKEQIYQLEPLLDTRLKELQYVLDGAAKAGAIVNLAEVLELFAFDATGTLTNGEGYGALQGNNVAKMILEALDLTVMYVAVVGNIPEWHSVIFGVMQFPGLPNMLPLVEDFIERNTGCRLREGLTTDKTEDMLSRFLPTALGQTSPKQTHEALRQMVETNGLAAADTTSTAMCSALQCLANDPRALSALREEVDKFNRPVTDDMTKLRITTTSTSYLDAVIKEAMRLHPSVGMSMPRVVPKGGAFISDKYFPQGCVVGTNAWLMHHDSFVWGSDHELFRPERWLSKEKDAVLDMNRTFFAFGAGGRECIGKHIAMMELQRLLAFVVTRYDFEIEDEGVSWKCMQFTQFSKMNARVTLRPEAK